MRHLVWAGAVVLSFGLSVGSVEAQSRPGGCLKYGLGGAVVGHFAGGHRLKGALAGCLAGMYQRRKYEREARERAGRNQTVERRREPLPDSDRNRPNSRSPYEDLGLDIDRSRPSGQANRLPEGGRNTNRNREGFEQGGSFSRGQFERERIPRKGEEPTETGSFFRGAARTY
jgi:hypothetical protein